MQLLLLFYCLLLLPFDFSVAYRLSLDHLRLVVNNQLEVSHFCILCFNFLFQLLYFAFVKVCLQSNFLLDSRLVTL